MIRKVTLRRFKRFDEVTFDLRGHVVLAGPNNCGKTTLLQAIAAWALALRKWREGNDFVCRNGGYSRVPIGRRDFAAVPLRAFDLLWTDRVYRKPIEIEISTDDPWTVAMELAADTTEQIYARPRGDASSELLRNLDFQVTFVPPMTGLTTEEPVYTKPKQEQLLGQGKPGEIIRNLLVQAYESEPAWKSLQSSIERLFGYQLTAPDARGAHIVADYRTRPKTKPLDLASAGSGFQQVLMLLCFLHAWPRTVLLLDEPDAHLHLILQDAIYGELRSVAAKWNSQLIVATHSEVIINSVAPEELCMLFRQPRLLASVAERKRLAESLRVLTNVDVMLAEEAKGVLFTEDYTDLNILREWAAILNHPLFPALETQIVWRKIGTQHRDGAAGISAKEYYDKLRLIRDDLPAVELVDGDAHSDVQSTRITGKGLQRLRWNRYEIESYLFHPNALARFVAEKIGAGAAGQHQAELRRYFEDNHPPAFLRNPHDDLPFLMGTKARTHLLPPALNAGGLPGLPYTRYHEIAAVMLREEVHPEVIEKLNSIQEAFGL